MWPYTKKPLQLSIVRAFQVDCLKFKLKFGLRLYFFYFSLPLFITLTSDSLFSTLFHLNIYSLFIFYYFLNSQNTFLFHFPFSFFISLCSVVYPLPLSFFFFFFFFSPPPTYHFFSLSFFLFSFFFFPHHPPNPPPFLFTSPLQQLHQQKPSNFSKKKPSKFTNFTVILLIANL
jgi:hypothetical protein